ncbi:hypothetical protein [Thaumasiovibrio subtropicus]|uniref:hypothetical protein n=1 Tax=Thaumasiovibrio subtropicus TaxID=1891207 RepID=UPI000B35C1C1|nr:hypothetical protein [Thaumasiovibrio subtropicus]
MLNDADLIDSLEALEHFLLAVENGGLGLKGVAGVALATSNSDGRRFIAVLDDNHQLLLGKYVTEEVFQKGQDMVRHGPQTKH